MSTKACSAIQLHFASDFLFQMANKRLEVVLPARNIPNGIRPQCAFVEDHSVVPPPLLEGDGLACNIIALPPTDATIPGPIMIEVPYSASLRALERELIIWRKEQDGQWTVHENIGSKIASTDSATFVNPNEKILRITTASLPRYFAIVSRIRQDLATIDPAGGIIPSTAVPAANVLFPVKAVKDVSDMAVQYHQIAPETASHFLGGQHAACCIVTIEPRRMKFDKPIKITVPVPKGFVKRSQTEYYCNPTHYRLYCSVAAEHKQSQWEDVTWCNNLVSIDNATIQFVTILSARYWLIDCGQEIQKRAHEEINLLRDVRLLYKEACAVPYWVRFAVGVRSLGKRFAAIHVAIVMDDGCDMKKALLPNDGTFREICRSGSMELTEADQISIEVDGNLHLVTKEEKQTRLIFLPLRNNIIRGLLKVHDPEETREGRLRILKDVRSRHNEGTKQFLYSSSIRV
ncbi:ankyrin-3-like [Paramacrobiotus metropolitanus]|uniref:ankyrin-3-like n=1 Tax=Paramacrobiotus metropolitanus TaxID=2943436 RepID=UPI002445FAC3|nr:ankyrin-3-like [Paramacrobiotus metropolitanus]